MSRKPIEENVKRRLYAESMGRCMNPNCQEILFGIDVDIAEKAHIVPYCETADNSFENLVLLCPNCHTKFDKEKAYTPEEVLSWKKRRQDELLSFFSVKYESFEELRKRVVPLLRENRTIYESYYLNENRRLWDKFESNILINNKKLQLLFEKNYDLFQDNKRAEYSNRKCIDTFLQHVREFEATRTEEEKIRTVLFPEDINSIFGIVHKDDSVIPSTESLEALIYCLSKENRFHSAHLDEEKPFIEIIEDDIRKKVFLNDAPRLRQLYHDYKCFRKCNIRLESLCYALKLIKRRHVKYIFFDSNSLHEIIINDTKIVFVYEYCLSELELRRMCPEKDTVIVNLHDWNGESCISKDAYKLAQDFGVTLLTTNMFYGYINNV